ncbi:uncharacterized protein BO95DRAFT_468977 [Aspergillus brunneoviolaceus CBS 621.78]|uniref:Uncharacterized protein n=1 Tax=Aspergillus brunneoviolaceus CBS 621.78 TaxID=1450534 RepID=A0ACD1FTB0_9EURO|nr:hypothetical protein BO95DRAFT_468977 [Aspergillus brunneoviolaceus CBS 621.78]RAH40203.1 hypothetical protein BO95DRAFT_468977 [Aspergillus brunneoviolaceus CBS 621.78]
MNGQVDCKRNRSEESAVGGTQRWPGGGGVVLEAHEIVVAGIPDTDEEHLPTVDPYSTIANQSVAPAELLARWKFHDPQTAAVYILSSLNGPIGIVQELPGTGKTFWIVRCLLLFLRNPRRDGKPYQLLIVSTCNDVGRILLSG